jgi:predicted RNA binding protein YcfA (HicA-like mRNA interferase family)
MARQLSGKQLLKLLLKLGCEKVCQKGSHVRLRCDQCTTTVPVHAGESLPTGTLRQIAKDLEPCLGKGWLES